VNFHLGRWDWFTDQTPLSPNGTRKKDRISDGHAHRLVRTDILMRFVEKSTAPAYYIICAAVRNVCRDFQPNETVMRFGVKLADFLRKLPALFAELR
jgi:hypothetical protein